MSLPDINKFGPPWSPLVTSPFDSGVGDEGIVVLKGEFLLENGNPFLLENGNNLLLQGS